VTDDTTTSQAETRPGGVSRRDLLVAAGAGAVVLAAAGPAAARTIAAAGPAAAAPRVAVVRRPRGQLVVATPGEAPTLFQNLEYQPQAYSIYDGVLEYLVKSDPSRPQLGPRPQLAVSWRPVGARRWEFKLRRGVKFHNGEEWDAAAAKANLDVLLTIKPPSPVMFRIQPYVGCRVKDKYTLIVETKEPWAMAPIGLSEVQFGAPAYLKDVGAQKFAQKPIGTGPYRFVEWDKGRQIVLEAFPEYWGRKATVERLVFRGIPDDASRFAALQAGEVDILEDLDLNSVRSAKSKGLRVADTPIAQSVLMTPYIIDAKKDGHPTADPRVRLAMNYAIDKRAIVQKVLGGYGKLMRGQITGADAFGWNPRLRDYPYNPQKAKALLSDAGHGNGVDLGTFFMGEPSEFLKTRDTFEVIRAQLGQVGIRVTGKTVEYSTFLRMALQEYSLKYWHIGGWQYYPVLDSAFALMWYDSDAFLRTGLGNARYDRLWRASNRELDPVKRKPLLQECQRIVHNTPGPVFLWQHHKLYAAGKRVRGFVPTPDERVHWIGVRVA
jgi:peptide/nickel transport system substrate-binding protein